MTGSVINPIETKERKRQFKKMREVNLLKGSTLPKDIVLSTLQVVETNAGKILFKNFYKGLVDASLTHPQRLKMVVSSMNAVDSNIKLINTLLKVEAEDWASEDFEQLREENLQVLRNATKYNRYISLEQLDPHKFGIESTILTIDSTPCEKFSSTLADALEQSIDICNELIADTKPKLDEAGLKVLAEYEKKFDKCNTLGKKIVDNLKSGKINLNHVAVIADDINRQVETKKSLSLKK